MRFATLLNGWINMEKSARDNGRGWATTAEEVLAGKSLAGMNIIVTGANTGIGFETTRALASAGASSVVLACRNMQLANAAVDKIRAQLPEGSASDVSAMLCDLSSLQSVRQFAKQYNALKRPLHVLVCNAGVMACPYTETTDGFEMQFGTNHLGHFLLTQQLMPSLKAADRARVVVVASAAHKFSPVMFADLSGKGTWYKGSSGAWKAYGQSKTANILFASELNRRMQEAGLSITANALHPGSIATDLQRHIISSPLAQKAIAAFGTFMFFKTIPQGAATSVHCATDVTAALPWMSGKYYSDSNVATPLEYAIDPVNAKRLWDISEALVAVTK
mmetsp:Transcript_12435/g.31823  ORF Transcript_12435/g.31823 Transcript_12435/m.31823 type:complete len:334 (-) Transcript_12435:241-1242(-)